MDKITTIQELNDRGYLEGFDVVDMELVFTQQEALMLMYKEAGKIPDWHEFDVVDKGNQVFLRDLMGFLEEEIIESQDAHEQLTSLALTNQRHEVLYPISEALNEEVADSLHFWVELFIYLGLTPQDLRAYYAALSKERGMNAATGDPLKLSLQFAESYINREQLLVNIPSMHLGYAGSKWVPYKVNGLRLNSLRVTQSKLYLFASIKHLKMARNTLKNKYWKSKDYPVNTQVLHHHLMEAWVSWTIAIHLMDFTDFIGILQTYVLKNKVNQNKVTLA